MSQRCSKQARIEQELQSLVKKFGKKIWDKNLGQTDGQTDRQTDETRHRVALQLKTVSMYFLYSITNNIFWSFCILYNIIEQFYFLNV